MKDLSKIVESESEILRVLWQDSPKTANEIYEAIKPHKDWQKSTVITLINRLVEKKAVAAEKRGVYFYTPLVTQEEYKEYHTRTFLSKLFDGSPQKLLAYFCDTKDITAADLDDIRKMIEGR